MVRFDIVSVALLFAPQKLNNFSPCATIAPELRKLMKGKNNLCACRAAPREDLRMRKQGLLRGHLAQWEDGKSRCLFRCIYGGYLFHQVLSFLVVFLALSM